MGEKWPIILPENARFPRNIQGCITCRKSTTWDRRLYFPSEGRLAEDFFTLKIQRLRSGLNPRTWYQRPSLVGVCCLCLSFSVVIHIIKDASEIVIKMCLSGSTCRKISQKGTENPQPICVPSLLTVE